MNLPWNADQVLAFAPDSGSAKAGRGLADVRHWSGLGGSERAVWGECQGSAKLPYQAQVDLSEPAFKCTCPSRKFPCKHGLGLLLLRETKPAAFPLAEPPAWVAHWVSSREGRATEKKKRDEEPSAVDAEAQAQRAANRKAKVSAGLDDLEIWIHDLISQGIASLSGKPLSFWDSRAGRLVDAQAPGIARLVREFGNIAASGEGWPERLLERLGTLSLIVNAWRRIDGLPPDVQADVRRLIGFTSEPDASSSIQDKWFVLGRAVEQQDRIRVQRTWLWGAESGRDALALEFSVGDTAPDASLAPGTTFKGAADFYPGAPPARASFRAREKGETFAEIPHSGSITTASVTYRESLAHRPWIERFPIRLRDVVPVREGVRWLLRDAEGFELAMAAGGDRGWIVAAASGGRPISVFGEWDGTALLPLSLSADARFVSLEQLQ
jgi:hypothetical protein